MHQIGIALLDFYFLFSKVIGKKQVLMRTTEGKMGSGKFKCPREEAGNRNNRWGQTQDHSRIIGYAAVGKAHTPSEESAATH